MRELLSNLVDERVSGGGGLEFETVDELNSGNHVGQELGAIEEPPFLGRGLHQFEDHREARHAGAVALGSPMSQPDGWWCAGESSARQGSRRK